MTWKKAVVVTKMNEAKKNKKTDKRFFLYAITSLFLAKVSHSCTDNLPLLKVFWLIEHFVKELFILDSSQLFSSQLSRALVGFGLSAGAIGDCWDVTRHLNRWSRWKHRLRGHNGLCLYLQKTHNKTHTAWASAHTYLSEKGRRVTLISLILKKKKRHFDLGCTLMKPGWGFKKK